MHLDVYSRKISQLSFLGSSQNSPNLCFPCHCEPIILRETVSRGENQPSVVRDKLTHSGSPVKRLLKGPCVFTEVAWAGAGVEGSQISERKGF